MTVQNDRDDVPTVTTDIESRNNLIFTNLLVRFRLWADHNDKYLYMLLEFVCGGELFSYLRNAGRFNNSKSNFYAAEIISALDYLHNKAIVYRDLKPENLLLDIDGHLKLTDFGFAKRLEDRYVSSLILFSVSGDCKQAASTSLTKTSSSSSSILATPT